MYYSNFTFKGLLLFLVVIIAQIVNAQNKLDSIQTLKEVVITKRPISKDIIPAQTLGGQELKRLSVVSVADAIRYFAGVQIKDYGGIGGLKTVNIRGMGTQHVGVFYDGIQLGNAQNGQIDLGRFSMDNMEMLSVYNGQKSNIFQPAKDFASAGSVYMTTRRPQFEEGKKNNLKLSLKGGSFETINPSALWEHSFTNDIAISLNAEYMYTSGKYKFSYEKKNGYDTTEVRQNGDVRALRIEGGLYGKIKNGKWQGKLYYYDSERGYPGASVREEPGKFKHEDRQWDRNFFAQTSFQKSFGRHYELLLNGKYAYDYLHYLSDPRLDVTTMYVDNHYRQQEAYFSVANKINISDWWRFNIVTDIQYNTLNADLTNFVYPSRYTSLTAFATDFDFDKLKIQGSLLYTYVHDETKEAGSSAGDKNEWTPTIVAMYKPFDKTDLSIRGFYKKIFRMPTFNDLYYTFIGNKQLKPEYTTQYNLGIIYSRNFTGKIFNRFEVQVDGYFNKVDDKIIAMPTSNQFQWTMINLGHVEIKGIDIALQSGWQFGKVAINSRLTYTYQKAQDFTDPSDNYYGGQIPYIPWHSGSAIIGTIYKDWDLNYSFIYTGKRYESSANIPENYAQPWYTHDLSLSKVIPLRNSDLRITAEVNNIFNQQYEVVQCYPMPGTNFKLKINWTL
ncbi:TonB-dependent receptor [Dysgonomonas sp. 511]|uniref:TonB-dependent receptor n=1 Tax=Dysgonomonas sp. 511 TaxID=2302930 RepID=UPI0013D1E0BA|nr:TonB-dependent receptor [Dysgonomonas sp. 511]NDV78970.1 TonB-dependent receptor [Dysgonomonas sp. 511]